MSDTKSERIPSVVPSSSILSAVVLSHAWEQSLYNYFGPKRCASWQSRFLFSPYARLHKHFAPHPQSQQFFGLASSHWLATRHQYTGRDTQDGGSLAAAQCQRLLWPASRHSQSEWTLGPAARNGEDYTPPLIVQQFKPHPSRSDDRQ